MSLGVLSGDFFQGLSVPHWMRILSEGASFPLCCCCMDPCSPFSPFLHLWTKPDGPTRENCSPTVACLAGEAPFSWVAPGPWQPSLPALPPWEGASLCCGSYSPLVSPFWEVGMLANSITLENFHSSPLSWAIRCGLQKSGQPLDGRRGFLYWKRQGSNWVTKRSTLDQLVFYGNAPTKCFLKKIKVVV